MTNVDNNPGPWEMPNGSTHTLRRLERKPGNKGMPQRRSRFCLCKYGTVNWTTYFCEDCGIHLCNIGKHGRGCWNGLVRCSDDPLTKMQGRRLDRKRARTD